MTFNYTKSVAKSQRADEALKELRALEGDERFDLRGALLCLESAPVNEENALILHREYYGPVDDDPCDAQIIRVFNLIDTIIAADFSRDDITTLAIEQSLCPLHFVDWAICFDDQDASCAQIRAIYPHHHDT